MKSYYSSGKLLLTGEYTVLDGAVALAVPTRYGQHLSVEAIEDPKLIWISKDENEAIWFENEFEIKNNTIVRSTRNNSETSNRLFEILQAALQLNPKLLNTNKGYKVTTLLEFPRNWGLGTSSTLINNIALWVQVDPFTLLEMTFGGSGYDIACAQHTSAITYQLIQNKEIYQDGRKSKKRLINPVVFNPKFKEHLYFVHLNKKQNSRDGIAQYKKNATHQVETISEINNITNKIITCNTLDDFNNLVEKHELIISKIIKQKPIKEELFSDFNGSIKSLGAWGGDYILATCKTNPKAYFKNKGFDTILSFDEMIVSDF